MVPIHEWDGKWWFWDETWSDRCGPFDTEEEARKDLDRYVRQELHGQVSEHFNAREFRCNCGCGLVIPDKDLLTRLEAARVHSGVVFVLNSATRCPKHNWKSGGVGGSSHLTGKAVDIRTRNFTERYRIIGGLYAAGFKRMKVRRGFVHTDVDEGKVQEWFGL